jgi:hypothetical protein
MQHFKGFEADTNDIDQVNFLQDFSTALIGTLSKIQINFLQEFSTTLLAGT